MKFTPPSKQAFGLMFISFTLSLLLWVLVRSQELPQGRTLIRSVRLQQAGLPEQRYVVTKIDEEIQLTLEGDDADVRSFNQTTVLAVVDLSGAVSGLRSYPVVIYPESVRKVISGPLTTRVEIEPLVRKKVEVVADTRGELGDPNFELQDLVVTPQLVDVEGPKSQVDKLVRLRAQLDLAEVNLKQKQSYSVGIEALGPKDAPLLNLRTTPLFVRVEPVVRAAPEERLVMIVPKIVGRPAEGFVAETYNCEPQQTTVTGRSLAIAGLTRVETEPIDIAGLSESRSFEVKLILPDGVRAPKASQVRVRVKIGKMFVPPPKAPEGAKLGPNQ
ncbi:MAG: YbbR-like domain-containing protein [Fimbriimonas sp.]